MFLWIDKGIEKIHICQVELGSAFVKAFVNPLVEAWAVSKGKQVVKVAFSSHDGQFFRVSDTVEKGKIREEAWDENLYSEMDLPDLSLKESALRK